MNYKEEVNGLLLEDLFELCYRAFSGTSFSPDRRAVQYVKNYSELLADDLEKLGENKGNYKEKFISKFSDWMSAKSRCLSFMITGPANFPVRKAEKANRSEENRYNDFTKWREKYFKAVNRVKTKSPEEELELAMKKLDRLIILQENMKAINKIVKKVLPKNQKETTVKDIQNLYNKLIEEEYPEALCEEAIKEHYGTYGFPRFRLTNNNAKIKNTEKKANAMKVRIERKSEWEDIKFEGGYVTIEDDRIKIFHDEKPEREIINEIKSSGFRWSPHWKCWCRKHTGNGICAMKRLSFINK